MVGFESPRYVFEPRPETEIGVGVVVNVLYLVSAFFRPLFLHLQIDWARKP